MSGIHFFRQRPAVVYLFVFFLSFVFPLALKAAFSNVGPGMIFYTACIISPICFLICGILVGGRQFLVNLILLVVASLFTWMVYPKSPAMNFQREVVETWTIGLASIYLTSAFLGKKLGSLSMPGRRQ